MRHLIRPLCFCNILRAQALRAALRLPQPCFCNILLRYNLFDWPTRPNSNLVVIGIANTMDLDERLLKRIASRLGLTKIQFKPYSKEQLVNIIKVYLPPPPLPPSWFLFTRSPRLEPAWGSDCVRRRRHRLLREQGGVT